MQVETQQVRDERLGVHAEQGRHAFPRGGLGRIPGVEESITVQSGRKESLCHMLTAKNVGVDVTERLADVAAAVHGALAPYADDTRHVRESAGGCHGPPAQPADPPVTRRRRSRRRGEGVDVGQGAGPPRAFVEAGAGAAAGPEDLAERRPELVVLEGVDPRVEAAVEDGQQREVVPRPGADVHVGQHLGQQAGQVGRPQQQEHPDDQGQGLGVLGVLDDEAYPQVVVHRVLHGGDGAGVVPGHHEDPEVAHGDGQAGRPHDGAEEEDVGVVVEKLEGAGLGSGGRVGLGRKRAPGVPAQRQRRPDDGGGVDPGEGDEDPDLADGHDGHVLEGTDQRRVAVVGDGGQRQDGHAARRHQDAVGSQAQQQVAHLTDTEQLEFNVTESTTPGASVERDREREKWMEREV